MNYFPFFDNTKHGVELRRVTISYVSFCHLHNYIFFSVTELQHNVVFLVTELRFMYVSSLRSVFAVCRNAKIIYDVYVNG